MVSPRPAIVLCAALAAGGIAMAAQYENLGFTGPSAWKTSATVPANSTPYLFPDGVSRAPGDFAFNGGLSSVWNLDQSAILIGTQTSTGAYNRFFIGTGDGKHATLTFTTGTPDMPGAWCARLSTSDSIRIGQASTNSGGTLRIDGGVKLQCGYVHGEGPSPSIEIINGRMEVLSGLSTRRLNGIAVTLSPRGQLWIEDSGGTVKSAATFSSFASGATITAAGGTLGFQNGVTIVPITGTSDKGTLITATPTVNPAVDADHDGLPDQWEEAYGLDATDQGSLNPDNGPNGDPDHDGLPNSEEYRLGSNPRANESGKAWLPRPSKAAMLVVNAHPDDEGIFFGGTYPYYTQVKQLPVVALSMTSGDNSLSPPVREAELRNALWTYGERFQPIFGRFRDKPTSTLNDTWDVWADGVVDGVGVAEGRVKAARFVATVIRRYRPEIVVTHGTTGEYGHQNHIATSLSVIDAYTLAADAATDLEGLPPWQVKKLYVHEWSQNRLFHDHWETAFPALGGLTPRQVTNLGLDFHVTQNKPDVSTAYLTGEVQSGWDAHPSELWGLYASKVGPDTIAPSFTVNGITYNGWAKRDFLENLNLDLDENGLPDDWEESHAPLAGTIPPDSDMDRDGVDSLIEYISGTDPDVANPPALAVDGTARTVKFLTRIATGTGYAALHRRYRLESSTDLSHWTPAWQGDADGNWKEIPFPTQAPLCFYRLVIILE
ncbi:PIG-L family deacetylase [Luteolibacter ambystomatis]|uniref:PIG-L family deacetylase n=1 Tax=Luteolibacter ambystomatis TaxID=2824561 RepID=A0A975G8R8_9BACT|nr:PIG-L family deacetylase [Luteolibacter ambystomatis]QUE51432.1 PIG-L family deacetylase [Luteolibacter ambystomatis]